MKGTIVCLIMSLFLLTVHAGNIAGIQFENLQSGFIENNGQVKDQNGNVNEEVMFIYSSKLFNLELKKSGFSYELFRVTKDKRNTYESETEDADVSSFYETSVTTERVDVVAAGANSTCLIRGENLLDPYFNYYINSESLSGIINVRSFNDVVYENIYPGIDLIFTLDENEPEYKFIVHPGANPKQIKLEYRGSSKMRIDEEGNLEIQNQIGEINEVGLKCFLPGNGKVIPSRLILEGNTTRFDVPRIKDQTLVIDPNIVYGAYYGGEGSEEINSEIAIDKQGKAVITGTTESFTGIATNGAYQQTLNGFSDACIAKFNVKGKLIWSTYYGGNDDDNANGISIDNNNNIYILGKTGSTTGIATAGSYQQNNGGGLDGFLAKFNTSGALQWSTFFGGPEDEELKNVACDKQSFVNIVGLTHSSSGISTPGSYQPTYAGGGDMVIARFTSSGHIRWSTYYGGSGSDRAQGVGNDLQFNIIICGSVASTNGISSPGAFQTIYGGGTADAAILKFDSAGHRLWASYFGGELDDHGRTPVADSSGNIYFEGFTKSTTHVATAGSFQPNWYPGYALNGTPQNDGFIAKFGPNGNRIWSSYYGGEGNDELYGACVYGYQNVYFVGGTRSEIGMVTSDAFQTELFNGAQDGLLIRMDTAGHRIYSTYLGGDDQEQINDIIADKSGFVYLTLYSLSTYIPVSNWVSQLKNNGSSDLGVYKFYPGSNCYDYNEPNESISQAPLITTVLSKTVYGYNGSISSPADQDWYKVKVQPDAPNIKIQIIELTRNYNLKITDAAGNIIDQSNNSGTANETVIINNPALTKYYICVVHDATQFDSAGCYRLVALKKSDPFKESDYSVEEELEPSMMIAPNPVSGSMQLSFYSNDEEKNLLVLYDQLLHVIKTEVIGAQKGNNHFSIDLTGIAAGLYIVEMKTSAGINRQRIVVSDF